MDRVTRCLHCGKRMVPMPHLSGRTELKCLFCDKLDPLEVTTANKWAESPLAVPFPSQSPERTAPAQQASGTDRPFR
jgi:hypothetical protein